MGCWAHPGLPVSRPWTEYDDDVESHEGIQSPIPISHRIPGASKEQERRRGVAIPQMGWIAWPWIHCSHDVPNGFIPNDDGLHADAILHATSDAKRLHSGIQLGIQTYKSPALPCLLFSSLLFFSLSVCAATTELAVFKSHGLPLTVTTHFPRS